jgi:ketosteroid isomerase-like protein
MNLCRAVRERRRSECPKPMQRRCFVRYSMPSLSMISTAWRRRSTSSSSSWTPVKRPTAGGQWRAFCGRFVKAFPDLTQEVTNLVDAGESAFAEVIARGTHTGPLETPDGDVPPTGRTIAVPFCVVVRARGGLLVDGREYYDSAALLSQLGLLTGSVEAGD